MSDVLSSGHVAVEIRLLMRPVLPQASQPLQALDSFLAYVQRFDFVSQLPGPSSNRGSAQIDPTTGMVFLKRSTRSDGTYLGDVIPVTQFRVPVELIPRFGPCADSRLTKENCHKYAREFLLDKYFDKDIFNCIHTP
jgi:hypothetical protein